MEVKDITDAVENATATGADLATGAALSAIEAITKPGRSAARLERKGAPARKGAQRELGSNVQEAREAVHSAAAAMLPERIALRGLSLVKARARRVDLVGEIAYRGLDLFHGSLKEVARSITRLERASEPPARPKRSLGRAARTSAAQTRSGAKRAGRRAASTTSRTRRTARRTSRRTATA